MAAAALHEKRPEDAGDATGPDSVMTKGEILNYLKASFNYLHKALLSINEKNEIIKSSSISPMLAGKATRLGLVVESLIHA